MRQVQGKEFIFIAEKYRPITILKRINIHIYTHTYIKRTESFSQKNRIRGFFFSTLNIPLLSAYFLPKCSFKKVARVI